jgi:hypothetical protein
MATTHFRPDPRTMSQLAYARASADLVGKKVRAAEGTECHAFSRGKPAVGTVIAVHMPDLAHCMLKIQYRSGIKYLSAFELDVITD